MDFNSDKPIFRQIVDLCHAHILQGVWKQGERVPSVRELALQLAVNSHTVLKSFELLQDEGIIIPRRGLGFFLADDARDRVLEIRRKEFFETTVPLLRKEMESLGITLGDIQDHLD